jgi:hypothetical protein
MDYRELVVRALIPSVASRFLGVLMAAVVVAGPSIAAEPSIRLYKLNNKGQLVNQRWVGDMDREGCHNLRGIRKVHRFAQVGYAWCELYRERGCDESSRVTAMWRGKHYRKADIDVSEPQPRLYPGSRWYLHPERNVEIASWYCRFE